MTIIKAPIKKHPHMGLVIIDHFITYSFKNLSFPRRGHLSYYRIGVNWVFHYIMTFFQGLISLPVISLAKWVYLVSTCALCQDGAG